MAEIMTVDQEDRRLTMESLIKQGQLVVDKNRQQLFQLIKDCQKILKDAADEPYVR